MTGYESVLTGNSSKCEKLHMYVVLLMLYFVIAPFEDLLTGAGGTVARYLAALIVVVALLENGFALNLRRQRYFRFILWITFVNVLSSVWAMDIETAVFRNITYVILPGFCVFVGLLDFSEHEYKRIVDAAILGGVMVAVYLIFSGQLTAGMEWRLTLTEHNDPNNFAALLLLPFIMGFDRMMRKTGFWKYVYIFVCLGLLFTIIITGSRGGFLATLLAVAGWFLLSKRGKFSKNFVMLVALVGVFVYFALPFIPEFLQLRVFNMGTWSENVSTHGQRLGIWRNIFMYVIPDMPFWGYGAGCAGLRLSYIYGYLKGVHNTYLEMFLETGIFCLPVFMLMLENMFRNLFRRKCIVEFAALLGICVVIFFLGSYAKKFFWNVIMLIVIMLNTPEDSDVNEE